MFIVPGTRVDGENIQASDLSQRLFSEIGDHNEDEEDDEIMKMMLMMTLVRICDTFSRMAEAFLPMVPSSITPPT